MDSDNVTQKCQYFEILFLNLYVLYIEGSDGSKLRLHMLPLCIAGPHSRKKGAYLAGPCWIILDPSLISLHFNHPAHYVIFYI